MKMYSFIKYILVVIGIITMILIFSIANTADAEKYYAMSILTIDSGIASRGDPINGKKVFKKCVACHSLQEGKNKIGPSLYNLLGRKAGSVEGYKYSKAMKNSDVVWDEESLDKFLTKPRKFIKRTKMSFRGIKKKSLREDLISFFKNLHMFFYDLKNG